MHISTLRQWLRHGSFASHQEMRVQTIHSCLAALMSCTCTPDIATCAAFQYYAVHSVIQWCGHEQPFLSLFPPSAPPPMSGLPQSTWSAGAIHGRAPAEALPAGPCCGRGLCSTDFSGYYVVPVGLLMETSKRHSARAVYGSDNVTA